MLDAAFLSRSASLLVPEMGTESTAPLLYWLVRTLRPQRVVEVGMGYTTPFLARALADNAAAHEQERSRLSGPAPGISLEYSDYYDTPYRPKLVCIDRMTDPASSATRAFDVVKDLGLSDVCEVIDADLRGASTQVRERLGMIDFAWIDTWNTLGFINEYWDLIDPSGGMLAIHYLMTYPEGRAVLRYLDSLRALEGGQLEISNLCEPHKRAQNSTTLVRRVRDFVDADDLRPAGTERTAHEMLADGFSRS